MPNSNLTEAQRAKNDEFYTQYHDIEKEISAYLGTPEKARSIAAQLVSAIESR